MDMADMAAGMSTGDASWQTTNMALARDYWYFIIGALGLCLFTRVCNYGQNRLRLRMCAAKSVQYPTKPTNRISQAWATTVAVCREISYPQLYVPFKGLTWMTPPPMGRVLVLLAYWAVIIYMMTAGAIVKDANFWERIGFRNAWVTIMQVPFLYLLSSKTSVIGLITGTGHERLNWFHRWVGRTIFVTATVHGFHFWTEWALAGFVQMELKYMPIVKYGLAAWAILLWQLVSSFKPFRSMAYEIFVVQHVVAAIAFIVVIYIHVPSYARYNVWFTIAALCFDRAFRLGLLAWQNIKFKPKDTRCRGGQKLGHKTQISAIGDSMTVLTIKDVHFKWAAGQHLYLWLPQVGPLETHPYTIASPHQVADTCICNSIQLVIRAHSGFSRRLHDRAKEMANHPGKMETLTAFVAGPYGRPPRWDVYETLVLISASTGASFTLPILESILNTTETSSICTKRIDFILSARQGEEIGFYHERLHDALALAQENGIELSVHIAVTGNGQLEVFQSSLSSASTLTASGGSSSSRGSKNAKRSDETAVEEKTTDVESGRRQRQNRIYHGGDSTVVEKAEEMELLGAAARGCCTTTTTTSGNRRLSDASDSDVHMHHSATRPDVAGFIRTAVEATGGETGVVVCGGASLVAGVRTSVARLSDERAVHKGTGAQGIFLHVEEYCF